MTAVPDRPQDKTRRSATNAALPSPARVFAATVLSIFVAEVLLIQIMGFFPRISGGWESVVDGTVLVSIMGPVLYVMVYRPMRLYAAKLNALSITDELTGLYNRRGFFLIADQQLRVARREMRRMVLIYADLDNLKQVNDTRGHETGDSALRATAAFLRANFRQSDVIARMGGDEFVVLQVGSDDPGASLHRLRETFEREVAIHLDGSLSLTAGVAVFDPAAPCAVEDLLSAADNNMYGRKRARSVTPLSAPARPSVLR